jgi:cyclase
MLRTRIMPCLLLEGGSLVKTVKFDGASYVGDPVNAVSIFNEKEVDELVLLDISAREGARGPDFALLRDISSECFMPLAYGGGVRRVEDFERLFTLGIEKVIVNTEFADNPGLVRAAADRFGSQSVVVSIDARTTPEGGYEVFVDRARRATGSNPVEYARRAEEAGAGELVLMAVERDGMREGYDTELLHRVTSAVGIPVIAAGGAGRVSDFGAAVRQGGASACAAGAMTVWFGRGRSVLISFPPRRALEAELA